MSGNDTTYALTQSNIFSNLAQTFASIVQGTPNESDASGYQADASAAVDLSGDLAAQANETNGLIAETNETLGLTNERLATYTDELVTATTTVANLEVKLQASTDQLNQVNARIASIGDTSEDPAAKLALQQALAERDRAMLAVAQNQNALQDATRKKDAAQTKVDETTTEVEETEAELDQHKSNLDATNAEAGTVAATAASGADQCKTLIADADNQQPEAAPGTTPPADQPEDGDTPPTTDADTPVPAQQPQTAPIPQKQIAEKPIVNNPPPVDPVVVDPVIVEPEPEYDPYIDPLERIHGKHEMDYDSIIFFAERYFGDNAMMLDLDDYVDRNISDGDMVTRMIDECDTQTYAKTVYTTKISSNTDTATVQENQSAVSDFMQAFADLQERVNNPNALPLSFADQNNYDMASSMVERLDKGEYILTREIEKATQVLQSIQVSTVETEDESNTEFETKGTALLAQLKGKITDDPSAPEDSTDDILTQNEYNEMVNFFDSADNKTAAYEKLSKDAEQYEVFAA